MESVKTFYDGKDPAHRFDHTERLYDFCVCWRSPGGREG